MGTLSNFVPFAMTGDLANLPAVVVFYLKGKKELIYIVGNVGGKPMSV